MILKAIFILRKRLERAVFGPILEQNLWLAQRQEEVLQKNIKVLKQVASTIREYVEQLAEHTEAVKNMAYASQELRDVVRKFYEMLRKS